MLMSDELIGNYVFINVFRAFYAESTSHGRIKINIAYLLFNNFD